MKVEYVFGDLTLKVLNESYSAEILDFYYRNREDFDRYETLKPDNFYTEEFIKTMCKAELNGFLHGIFARYFLYFARQPEIIIGTVSFSHILTGSINTCTIGYKTDRYFRRRGYALFMIKQGIEIMVKEKGMHRIESYIHPDNIPSIQLVKKAGFIDEGIAHSYVKIGDIWQDHLRYTYIS